MPGIQQKSMEETQISASGESNPSPEPVPAPAAVEVPVHPVLEEVEVWFRDHFHGIGPRLSSELFSEFHKAKEELKRRLASIL